MEDNLGRYTRSTLWDKCGYQLSGLHGDLYSDFSSFEYGCVWKKQDDILEMRLDLNQQTLSFKRNGEDFGIGFENVKKSYEQI